MGISSQQPPPPPPAPLQHFMPLKETLPYQYGHAPDLEEGKELYTRKDLLVMGGHLAEFRDVHGSMKEGADSVVLCHLVSPNLDCVNDN